MLLEFRPSYLKMQPFYPSFILPDSERWVIAVQQPWNWAAKEQFKCRRQDEEKTKETCGQA